MDYTTATQVDRAELLEIQNLDLQKQLLEARQEVLAQKLLRKYGTPDQENMRVRSDGVIDRAGTSVPELAAVPAA